MLFAMKKKCQAAVEFLILFAIAISMLTGFMYFSRGQFDTIEEKQIVIDANALADDMTSYVVFSLRTEYLKVKDFRLPIDIGGREYTASLAQDVAETYLVLNLTDTGRLFYYPLKKKVNGSIDKTATYAHCITSKEGVASIDPSMIELEPGRIKKGANPWRDINESDFKDGVLEVGKNDEFSIYAKGNCLHDLKEVRATIEFNPSLLEMEKPRMSAGDHEQIEKEAIVTPYGGVFFSAEAEANCTYTLGPPFSEIEIYHESPEIGPVGSDRLIELVFQAHGFVSAGTTAVTIAPTYLEDSLIRTEPLIGDSIEIRIV